jgi:ATP phosphoribosyltransferase regulatory subunit
MTHPTPPGTRDILPEEMRELRRLEAALVDVFERFGYGEVSTPTIEYGEILAQGDERGAPTAHRFFDEQGDLVAMRSDMTIPIARLVSDRFAGEDPPFRLFYVGKAYRAVRPQRGQMREFTQAGIELVGSEAPLATAEMIAVLSAALDAVGLQRAVIGLGHAALYRQLLTDMGVSPPAQGPALERLAEHDLVGLDAEVRRLGIGPREMETLLRIPALRGGREVLEEARALGGEAVTRAATRLEATLDALDERGAADRVRVDLGLLRDLGYYTGAIVEVYDPALGHILGGGGRYDELMSRFGRPLPAAGFALYLERVHVAVAEEERVSRGRVAAGGQPGELP